ncbi:hypothetical protein [Amycolatopsis regifaucium]|nr:hypothetical protein [Amycolatopsis regifaucium]
MLRLLGQTPPAVRLAPRELDTVALGLTNGEIAHSGLQAVTHAR